MLEFLGPLHRNKQVKMTCRALAWRLWIPMDPTISYTIYIYRVSVLLSDTGRDVVNTITGEQLYIYKYH